MLCLLANLRAEGYLVSHVGAPDRACKLPDNAAIRRPQEDLISFGSGRLKKQHPGATCPFCDRCPSVLQDVSGGKPVPVEGTALPLWGLEIDPDRAKEDFRAFNAGDDGKVGHIAC